MYTAEDAAQLTYVQCGIPGSHPAEQRRCGLCCDRLRHRRGRHAGPLNSFPGVICGHVEDPVDAYTFAHVNDGNAVAMPLPRALAGAAS